MPWKGEKDPYKIWISEIILQQTRVQQGLAYYERFIHAFPDVKTLATVPEMQVFKLWEGLGYYSRCRNILATAQYIHHELKDKFPEKYEDILALKGIGPYTAAAISSFAYGLPYAVVDGNVFRVLSRYFGIDTPINSTEGKKQYALLAQQLLDKKNAGSYNQAIMDFGAVICKPVLPLCFECPLQNKCFAFQSGKVAGLPVNEKKILQTKRYFNYLVINNGKHFYTRQRTKKDIWQNLYEFVLIETNSSLMPDELVNNEQLLEILSKTSGKITAISNKYSQKLTHQLISGRFIHIEINNVENGVKGYHLTSPEELKMLPLPKLIASYLKDKNVSLNLDE